MRKFKQIYVEITNVCNLNCSFCPKNSRAKRFMSTEEFDLITNEISPLTNTICLHLMGEPLLHPNLKEILEISSKKNLGVYLTTNGTLIKQNLELLKLGFIKKISVSLHSYEANDNLVSLDKYLEDILVCCKEISQSTKTCIEFRLWNESSDKNVKNTLNNKIIDKNNLK